MIKRFTNEQIETAKYASIVPYLQSQGEYLQKEKDWYIWINNTNQIVRIKNGYWCIKYTGEEGSAIDFIKKYKNLGFIDAVEFILNYMTYDTAITIKSPKNTFKLPDKYKDNKRIFNYLFYSRKIDPSVINSFIDKKLIYENEFKGLYNVVFVGNDTKGEARHAHIRGANDSSYRRDAKGSDKRFSFNWVGNNDTVYLFEAPIDMLSYITLHKAGWENNSYVAACGVSSDSIMQFLQDHKNITKVYLCFDNDHTGMQYNNEIKTILDGKGYETKIKVSDLKDWNEDLKKVARHNFK